MAGGSATHAGIRFEDQVAGLLSVHVLADAPVDFFRLPSGVTPIFNQLKTACVNDILVGTSATGFCFVNVKKGVTYDPQILRPTAKVARFHGSSKSDGRQAAAVPITVNGRARLALWWVGTVPGLI
jgi:hypothetical protein